MMFGGESFASPKKIMLPRNEVVPDSPVAAATAAAAMANSCMPRASAASSKQRLRWTPELHEQFVSAVTQLGGADRATPKGVLKMMSVPGLTIYHIKSHLQKYRLAKYSPEALPHSDHGSPNARSKNISDTKQDTNGTSGIHLTETLRVHVEVQKRLQEQLEVQRQLQLRIEAQGRYLQNIIEEQEKMSRPALDSQSRPTAPPMTPFKEPLESISKQDSSASESIMEEGFSDSGASSPTHSAGNGLAAGYPGFGDLLHPQMSSPVLYQNQQPSGMSSYQHPWAQRNNHHFSHPSPHTRLG